MKLPELVNRNQNLSTLFLSKLMNMESKMEWVRSTIEMTE